MSEQEPEDNTITDDNEETTTDTNAGEDAKSGGIADAEPTGSREDK